MVPVLVFLLWGPSMKGFSILNPKPQNLNSHHACSSKIHQSMQGNFRDFGICVMRDYRGYAREPCHQSVYRNETQSSERTCLSPCCPRLSLCYTVSLGWPLSRGSALYFISFFSCCAINRGIRQTKRSVKHSCCVRGHHLCGRRHTGTVWNAEASAKTYVKVETAFFDVIS